MSTIRLARRVVSVGGILVSAVLTAAAASASATDGAPAGCLAEMHDAARTWAMSRIAVIQADQGNFQDAKRTAAEIGRPYAPGPIAVTGVWFRCGQPVYYRTPCLAPMKWRPIGPPTRADSAVPAATPTGLPDDYLAADPRHGKVVGFTDELDSRGTRVTTRTYADGHVVIETQR